MKRIIIGSVVSLILWSCTNVGYEPPRTINRFCSNSGFSEVPYKNLIICVSNDYYSKNDVRMPVDLDEALKIIGNKYVLPTPAMVDAIWRAADVKLQPKPLPAGSKMTSMEYFIRHDQIIDDQLSGRSGLIAGHKKDLIRVPADSRNVGIYGWHRLNGVPIQPKNVRSHDRSYKDYSHGLRLIMRYGVDVSGNTVDLALIE